MSVIPHVITKLSFGVYRVFWETLQNGDTGTPFDSGHGCPAFSDKSVQVTGTFGSGGSINMEGSNDDSNWEILDDPVGDALTYGAKGMSQILELTKAIRPAVTAGDGTTDIDVTMIVRGFLPLQSAGS